jgi:hypothetical protein
MNVWVNEVEVVVAEAMAVVVAVAEKIQSN